MPPALMQGVRATRTARRILTLFSEANKVADSASSRCSSEGTVWDGSLLPLPAQAAGRKAESRQNEAGTDADRNGQSARSKRRTITRRQHLRLRTRPTRTATPRAAQIRAARRLHDGATGRRQDQVALKSC